VCLEWGGRVVFKMRGVLRTFNARWLSASHGKLNHKWPNTKRAHVAAKKSNNKPNLDALEREWGDRFMKLGEVEKIKRELMAFDKPYGEFVKDVRAKCINALISRNEALQAAEYIRLFHSHKLCIGRFSVHQLFVDLLAQNHLDAVLDVLTCANSQVAVETCNFVLGELLKRNEIEKALKFAEEMKMAEINADLTTYKCLFEGVQKLEDKNKVKELMEIMKQHGVCPDLIFDRYFRKKGVFKALKMLETLGQDDISVNVNAYNSLIGGLLNAKDLPAALELLENMKKQGVSPSVETYTSIVHTLAKEKKMQEAFEYLDVMKSEGIMPNVKIYNCLINGLARCGEMAKALATFEHMKQEKIHPNVVTYNALVNGLARLNEMDKAFEVLEIMKNDNIPPNTSTYNSLINALSHQNEMKGALEVVEKMEKQGISPSTETFNSLLDACMVLNNKEMALELMKTMIDKGVPINKTSKLLISQFIKKEEVQVNRIGPHSKISPQD
jgi:pentatricopeptide repeat protein